jgi:hypothetical protein
MFMLTSCKQVSSPSVDASAEIRQQQIVGIWELPAAETKEQYFENGSLLSKQIAYIDGKGVLEVSTGRWTITSGKLILTFDDLEGSWVYDIRSIGNRKMVLAREDYIDTWTRSDDMTTLFDE